MLLKCYLWKREEKLTDFLSASQLRYKHILEQNFMKWQQQCDVAQQENIKIFLFNRLSNNVAVVSKLAFAVCENTREKLI